MSQEQQATAGTAGPTPPGTGGLEAGTVPSPASVRATPPAPDAAQMGEAEAGSPGQDPRVDDALSRMSELEQLPLAEQVEVYTDVHRRLAAVLADPDSQAQ